MRKWWVWPLLIFQAASLLAAAPTDASSSRKRSTSKPAAKSPSRTVDSKKTAAKKPSSATAPVVRAGQTQSPASVPAQSKQAIATTTIDENTRATLTRDYEIEVTVQSHDGDAWTRLARRITGDSAHWEEIATINGSDETLRRGMTVRVPFLLLRHVMQRQIIATLFPNDRLTPAGWRHTVIGARGIEGESLWKIAEWFTGDGANYTRIRKANPGQALSTRKGDVILVPTELLTVAFGGGMEEKDAPKAAEVRKRTDGEAQRTAANEDVQEAVAAPPGKPSLTYERSGSDPHAVYRLQRGEALYSSVAIRFTGRVYAKDVNDVLDRIVEFNAIEDVARLPVGYRVKIPMELLLPEYRPQGDPTRVAREETLRASAKVARRTQATGLTGVHVIIDAGHGGRDVGTEHDDVRESTYVYDVALRLKRLLEKKSAARVSVTTKSSEVGFSIVERDVLPNVNDHFVQTTPKYRLEDAVVGVNLRWYLANSIFRKTIESGVQKEKVVFISLHADSLHPSLRGAMAYIPGADYVKGSFEKSGPVYLARAEVRERPRVKQSADEALVAEGLSRGLAEAIIASFEESGLKVHPFSPVRDNVVRAGREWVPAVIRHNKIPTRMLLEVCNLGNAHDRELIQTQKYRQRLATAIYDGFLDFFATGDVRPASPVVTAAAGK